MLRSLTLSLLMLVSIGVMLPIASSTAHGLRQSVAASQPRKFKRHSRAWWRRYRARLRARRAAYLAAHRNRQLQLQSITPSGNHTASNTTTISGSIPKLPAGWNSQTSNSAEMKFRTSNGADSTPGQASLSVVAMSRPMPAYVTAREEKKLLSGVSHAELRRIVIDKMITSGGWVTNDYVRDVTGHRVFVVVAQTPSDGRSPEKSWNFYFTEVNGKIYSLTTNTPPQFASRMEMEAESFIASLYPAGKK
jgi:hypothetical protein